MAAGTAGNLGWDPSGAVSTEPVEGLKEAGYAASAIPTSENWNWLLNRLGAASIRRFQYAEQLIEARQCGAIPQPETAGLVLPYGMLPIGYSRMDVLWELAGDANETQMCADGLAIWLTVDDGAGNYTVRRRSRINGAVEDNSAAGSFDYPFIATAGGNLYLVTDNGAGVPRLYAVDRGAGLPALYNINLPAGAMTAYAVATDGFYVCVAAGNGVYLYSDTGAAFSYEGTYNHGAAISSIAMNGRRIVIGGTAAAGAPPYLQMRVLTYAPALDYSMSRTTGSGIVAVANYSDNRVGWCGAPDVGLARGINLGPDARWERGTAGVIERAAVMLADGSLCTANDGGGIIISDPVDGEMLSLTNWDPMGAVTVNQLAYDYDGLFALGDVTAAGHRLKRYCIATNPCLYSVISDLNNWSSRHYTWCHSLIQPIGELR
jgi:hypothetical protein